jgi:hypothetical protein
MGSGRSIEQAYTRVCSMKIFDDRLCAIGGAAVDDDNFFDFSGLGS